MGRVAFRYRSTLTDDAIVEPFNGRVCDGGLNGHRFLSMTDAETKIEA
jgi:hypothetical protein